MGDDHAGAGVVRTWPRRACNDASDAPTFLKKISDGKNRKNYSKNITKN